MIDLIDRLYILVFGLDNWFDKKLKAFESEDQIKEYTAWVLRRWTTLTYSGETKKD